MKSVIIECIRKYSRAMLKGLEIIVNHSAVHLCGDIYPLLLCICMQGHVGHVLCISLSSDDKILVSGMIFFGRI